jgi:hypothetical protein
MEHGRCRKGGAHFAASILCCRELLSSSEELPAGESGSKPAMPVSPATFVLILCAGSADPPGVVAAADRFRVAFQASTVCFTCKHNQTKSATTKYTAQTRTKQNDDIDLYQTDMPSQ